jgi:aminoglycoside 3-N-acetyltransferase
MTDGTVPKAQLIQQLGDLGVRPGMILLVHTSFGEVRPVEGGPNGLIEALRRAIGPRGTLVMPSMTDDDDHPFNPATTPTGDMGIVAETFWRLPGVLRSDSPHAFAAIGPEAAHITAPHPIDVPHGLDSPVGRVYELDGWVLLLGVTHHANTTIHLAENVAGVRYRRPKYVTILQDGKPTRFHYAEVDHCTDNFELLGKWLTSKGLQRTGPVGHTQAILARSRDVVNVVMERLRQNETVFLHDRAVDDQCDEARASIPISTSAPSRSS